MGLLDQVKPVKDTAYYIKLLLYGPSGAGKTRFAAEAPNPVWIDVERSTETFRNIPEYSDIPVFRPKSFTDIDQFCREVVRKKAYDTIVIDTIGRVQNNQIVENLEEVTKDGKGGRKRSQYMPLWGDYRESTNIIDPLFVFLQEADIHVIIIAHDRIDMDPDTKSVVRISPDLTPTLAGALIGLINVVGYLEVVSTITGTRERKLTINPINKIEAKNRLNIQEASIKQPTFKGIFLT